MQALLRNVEEGKVASPEEFKMLCEKVSDSINYKLCPGIGGEEYAEYKELIRYDQKQVVFVDAPVKRIESAKCKRWFPLIGSTVEKSKRKSPVIICQECANLRKKLKEKAKQLSTVNPKKKVEHQQAKSVYPKKYLSPHSLHRRELNTKAAQAREKRMLKQHIPEQIILDDRQHNEMSHVHSVVDEVASSELESIFKEGDGQGTEIGSTMRQIWEQDRRTLHNEAKKSFYSDQDKNGEIE